MRFYKNQQSLSVLMTPEVVPHASTNAMFPMFFDLFKIYPEWSGMVQGASQTL